MDGSADVISVCFADGFHRGVDLENAGEGIGTFPSAAGDPVSMVRECAASERKVSGAGTGLHASAPEDLTVKSIAVLFINIAAQIVAQALTVSLAVPLAVPLSGRRLAGSV